MAPSSAPRQEDARAAAPQKERTRPPPISTTRREREASMDRRPIAREGAPPDGPARCGSRRSLNGSLTLHEHGFARTSAVPAIHARRLAGLEGRPGPCPPRPECVKRAMSLSVEPSAPDPQRTSPRGRSPHRRPMLSCRACRCAEGITMHLNRAHAAARPPDMRRARRPPPRGHREAMPVTTVPDPLMVKQRSMGEGAGPDRGAPGGMQHRPGKESMLHRGQRRTSSICTPVREEASTTGARQERYRREIHHVELGELRKSSSARSSS